MSRMLTATCWLLILPAFCSCSQQVDKAAPDVAADGNGNAAPTQPAAPQPKPEEILAQVADFYSAVKTIQVSSDRQTQMEFNGQQNSVAGRASLIAERPNRFVLENKNQLSLVRSISDGESLFLHMPAMKRYSQIPAPDTFNELAQNQRFLMLGGGMVPIPLQLLSENPVAMLTEGVSSSTYVGKEQLHGGNVHHLKFQQQTGMPGVRFEWELWVAAEGDPLVRQFRRSTESSQQVSVKNVITETFNDWKFNEPPAPEAFAFTPPEGTEKVDNLLAAGFGGPGRKEPERDQEPIPSSGNPVIDFFRTVDRGVKSTTPKTRKPTPDEPREE